MGAASKCRNPASTNIAVLTPPYYETFWGADLILVVNPITFNFPVFGKKTLGESFGLPYTKKFSLKPKSLFSCNFCSGCLSFATYAWFSGDWTSCTAVCGGGIQTRLVQCRDAINNPASEALCRGNKAESSQSCNTDKCPVGQPATLGNCPSTCTALMLGNGFCNTECNSLACAYDKTDCFDSCSVNMNCLTCSASTSCGT